MGIKKGARPKEELLFLLHKYALDMLKKTGNVVMRPETAIEPDHGLDSDSGEL